jgi:molybdopterin/thiamine biosynthesis adenylyltransferase
MNKSSQFHEVKLRAGGPHGATATAARLPALVHCKMDVAQALRELAVAICGCGSVGSAVALDFARMGVGTLYLVDPKNIKPASLLTHPVDVTDIGRSKARTMARRCKAINPAARVFAFAGPVEALGLDALVDADVVVMATDRLSAEVHIGQTCLHLGKPLVQAAVHGETLAVNIRFFSNRNGQGPCPACAYGRLEREHLNREVRYSCEGAPHGDNVSQANEQPTMSFGSLCGLAAHLGTTQVLRYLLGLGEPVDTLLEYCGYTNRMVTCRLARNPQCNCDHLCYAIVALPDLGRHSLAGLCEATGFTADASTLFTVGRYAWWDQGDGGGAQPVPVRRFVAEGKSPRRGQIKPLAFYTYQAVTASVLGEAFAAPLQKLGAGATPYVLARNADAALLIRHKSKRGDKI